MSCASMIEMRERAKGRHGDGAIVQKRITANPTRFQTSHTIAGSNRGRESATHITRSVALGVSIFLPRAVRPREVSQEV